MMAAETTRQYRPLSTDETSADDAYNVSAVRIHASNINNACIHVFNHKLLGVPCIPNWFSWDTTDTEHLIGLFVGLEIPDTFDQIAWTIGHQRTAGSGSDSIEWRMYADEWAYYGSASTIDTTVMSAGFTSSTITTDSNTHDHAEPTYHAVVRGANGWCWLCLTALNSDNTVRGKITSLDIWPYRT
jgi:hypothetical protein